MVDISVKSWLCQAEGHHLSDVLQPVYVSDEDGCDEDLSQLEMDETKRCRLVQLEQPEDDCPCVLTLSCSSSPLTSISRLLVISQARTMEVYSHEGDYCGTARGERDDRVQTDSPDGGVFYRKQLTLKHPSSACEVKLLSLGGRRSISLCRVVVGMWQVPSSPAYGATIDMQQVQSLVEEMGTSLSPGAQNLMDMVRVQQLNQSSAVGGFLPLLMGGGLFSARMPPAATQAPPLLADPVASLLAVNMESPTVLIRSHNVHCHFEIEELLIVFVLRQQLPPHSIPRAHETPPSQNGVVSEGCSSPELHSPLNGKDAARGDSSGPLSRDELTDMMSHILKGQGGNNLLPVLQGVCGQVTKLRLDDVAEEKMRNGSWELDAVMDRRLEQMEKRLKEHLDRRLDALELKIETLLMNVLPQMTTGGSTAVEGPASCRPPEAAAAAASH
ncbi:ATPase PAAT isoform X1 [Nelusetta ayraudi]|uniref:ATPase PAAT isoform X1 n=1 Tax=Nelusetta ayraudi TaxID=303726 RepID=UPI003F6F4DFC